MESSSRQVLAGGVLRHGQPYPLPSLLFPTRTWHMVSGLDTIDDRKHRSTNAGDRAGRNGKENPLQYNPENLQASPVGHTKSLPTDPDGFQRCVWLPPPKDTVPQSPMITFLNVREQLFFRCLWSIVHQIVPWLPKPYLLDSVRRATVPPVHPLDPQIPRSKNTLQSLHYRNSPRCQ